MSRRMTSFKNMNEIRHMDTKDSYVIVLAKSKKNYSALSPDVPGCYTVGDTVEETLKHMREALAFHLEDEDTMPEPRGLEYHLRHDEELRDDRFIFAYIPVSVVAPQMAHA